MSFPELHLQALGVRSGRLHDALTDGFWLPAGLMADPGTGALAQGRDPRIVSFTMTLAGMLLFGTAVGAYGC